jgi:hypothetical protein
MRSGGSLLNLLTSWGLQTTNQSTCFRSTGRLQHHAKPKLQPTGSSSAASQPARVRCWRYHDVAVDTHKGTTAMLQVPCRCPPGAVHVCGLTVNHAGCGSKATHMHGTWSMLVAAHRSTGVPEAATALCGTASRCIWEALQLRIRGRSITAGAVASQQEAQHHSRSRSITAGAAALQYFIPDP